MAKQKKSKKKQAKADKSPKSSIGIEVPAELRELGAKLLEKARSPEGARVIAAGLAVAASAAAVAAERQRERNAASRAPEPANDPSGEAARNRAKSSFEATTMPDPRALAETIAGAADAFVKGLFRGNQPG